MTRNQDRRQQTRKHQAPTFIAWHVTERTEGQDKSFWTRIGAAWEHEDGDGLSLRLDLFPLSGRVVLRRPKEDESAEG